MRVLGLVTARGGSKGFPGKNMATIAGRPLVCWAHRALEGLRALHPGVVVRLSTDDAEIAAAWPAADRPQRLRPAHLAGDRSTSLEVVEHELAEMASAGLPCDAVLLLQPTCPLVTVGDLEHMWRAMRDGAESVIGAAQLEHPIQWCFGEGAGGRIEPVTEWSTAARSQHRTAFRPIGVYLVTTAFLRRERAFAVPGKSAMVVIPQERAIDIDYPIDLDLATQHLRRCSGERGFSIGRHRVGTGSPAFLIAEAGVNHNGDAGLARELIDAAAEAGASAVKFQTFKTSKLVTGAARMAAYQKENMGQETSQAEMLRRLELPVEALERLRAHAAGRGVEFLSSPFDVESARLLAGLGVGAIKLGSGEITHRALLEVSAGMGLPLILSTGMATLEEVEEAAEVVRGAGDPPVAWLHCVSSYPAPEGESNVRAMDALRVAVGGPVGMSDHCAGWEVTLASIALGASVIEKHLTLSRDLPGPDHKASLEPGEFAAMVRQVRLVESALGDGRKIPAACEMDTRRVARRSLVAARAIAAGETLGEADVQAKRPEGGISPMRVGQVLGRRVRRALAEDEMLAWGDLEA